MPDVRYYKNEVQMTGTLDTYPYECPICRQGIAVLCLHSVYIERTNLIQCVFRCPRLSCNQIFIANYQLVNPSKLSFQLKYVTPFIKKKREFSETISRISKMFCEIYQQAQIAEEDKLFHVCGPGYGKALEFLIKDYLLRGRNGEEAEKIKQKFLGQCISENIDNENIKNVASRATWLRNDETHYIKKWEDKDLQDLKKIIDLTVHWIEMQVQTDELLKSMPEGKK